METLTAVAEAEPSGDRTLFVVVGASIVGGGHAALRKNRQDAMSYASGAWGACGVVSDGCGSGDTSELGAIVTAHAMQVATSAAMQGGAAPRDALLLGADAVRSLLVSIADRCSFGASRRSFAAQHLLATVVAFAVENEGAAILACGDGLAWADGQRFDFDQNNEPSYLDYSA